MGADFLLRLSHVGIDRERSEHHGDEDEQVADDFPYPSPRVA
jgi:hypothetical protein